MNLGLTRWQKNQVQHSSQAWEAYQGQQDVPFISANLLLCSEGEVPNSLLHHMGSA
jgi:hypothetical protein